MIVSRLFECQSCLHRNEYVLVVLLSRQFGRQSCSCCDFSSVSKALVVIVRVSVMLVSQLYVRQKWSCYDSESISYTRVASVWELVMLLLRLWNCHSSSCCDCDSVLHASCSCCDRESVIHARVATLSVCHVRVAIVQMPVMHVSQLFEPQQCSFYDGIIFVLRLFACRTCSCLRVSHTCIAIFWVPVMHLSQLLGVCFASVAVVRLSSMLVISLVVKVSIMIKFILSVSRKQ